MATEKGDAWAVAIAGLLLVGVLALAFFAGRESGWKAGEAGMQRQAIEHGAAEYDKKTGEWKWSGPRLDPIPIPPDPHP